MCLIYRIACSVCHRMLLHELYARLIAASTRAATSGLCQSFGQKFDTAQSSFAIILLRRCGAWYHGATNPPTGPALPAGRPAKLARRFG